MSATTQPARAVCPECGKKITLTKAGVLRHHNGFERDFPGAPFTKLCAGAGKAGAR